MSLAKPKMADGNKRPFTPLEVRVIGGGRYDLEKLPKIKSGVRRRASIRPNFEAHS